MTRNPYSPPESFVADVVSVPISTGISSHVVRACTLLWWSFGVGILASVLNVLRQTDPVLIVAGLVGSSIGVALGFLLVRWGTRKLTAGRNWMRLLITVAYVAGILLIAIFWDAFRPYFIQYLENPAIGVVTLVQWTLHLCAVVLINTSTARAWFASQKDVVQGAA